MDRSAASTPAENSPASNAATVSTSPGGTGKPACRSSASRAAFRPASATSRPGSSSDRTSAGWVSVTRSLPGVGEDRGIAATTASYANTGVPTPASAAAPVPSLKSFATSTS